MIPFWFFGLIPVMVGGYALYELRRALDSTSSHTRESFDLIWLSAMLYVIQSALTVFLALVGIETTHAYWNVVIALYLATAACWLWAMYKLYKFMTGLAAKLEGVKA